MGYHKPTLLRCSILRLLILLSFLSLPLASPAAATEAEAASVMACMRENLPTRLEVEEFVVLSSSQDGNRETLSGEIYFTRERMNGDIGRARAMMRITQPVALRDSAYLILETDDYLRDGMFVYLPAIARVRRVNGEIADGRLFGTDITYYDFKQIRSAFGDMDAQYLKQDIAQNRPVHNLRLTPDAEVNAGYDELIAQVDIETCLPLNLSFYQQGELIKDATVPAHAIEADGERWYPTEFTLRDRINNSQSTLKTIGFRSDEKLPERLFHPASFYKAH